MVARGRTLSVGAAVATAWTAGRATTTSTAGKGTSTMAGGPGDVAFGAAPRGSIRALRVTRATVRPRLQRSQAVSSGLSSRALSALHAEYRSSKGNRSKTGRISNPRGGTDLAASASVRISLGRAASWQARVGRT